MLALPGGAYIYQGEELGLAEVEDLPDEVLQDPGWEMSGHTNRGRDGSRVPIPWSGSRSPFGFSPNGASAPPWLPQPIGWASLTVAAETGDPGSMLELYRRALALRHERSELGDGALQWLEAPTGALVFRRGETLACVVNVSAESVAPPPGATPLLVSAPLTDAGAVARDAAGWFSL
jgi:alpha-glucosidase